MKTEWKRHVETLFSMCGDELYGKGPTKEAFVANLRLFADAMEKLPEYNEPLAGQAEKDCSAEGVVEL